MSQLLVGLYYEVWMNLVYKMYTCVLIARQTLINLLPYALVYYNMIIAS